MSLDGCILTSDSFPSQNFYHGGSWIWCLWPLIPEFFPSQNFYRAGSWIWSLWSLIPESFFLSWLFFQFFLHIYFLSSVLDSLVYGSKGWRQSLFDSVKFAFFIAFALFFSPHESVLPSGFDRAYRLRLYQSLMCLLSFPYLCFLFLPSYSSPMISLSAFPSLSQYVFIFLLGCYRSFFFSKCFFFLPSYFRWFTDLEDVNSCSSVLCILQILFTPTVLCCLYLRWIYAGCWYLYFVFFRMGQFLFYLCL
jgi:hypothetical protein